MGGFDAAGVGSLLPSWTGKTVVDATNAHYAPGADDVLKGRPSAHYTAEKFPAWTPLSG
jgi:8-hydroxy-5-deazaflavin:NADPH oxidoreductase